MLLSKTASTILGEQLEVFNTKGFQMKMSINYGPVGQVRSTLNISSGEIIAAGISEAFTILNCEKKWRVLEDIEVVRGMPYDHPLSSRDDKDIVAELEVVIRDEAHRDVNGRSQHRNLKEDFDKYEVRNLVLEMIDWLFEKKAERHEERDQKLRKQLSALAEIRPLHSQV